MAAQSGGIALDPVVAADAHIERPSAAVMTGGLLEADNQARHSGARSQIGTARRSTPADSPPSAARSPPYR